MTSELNRAKADTSHWRFTVEPDTHPTTLEATHSSGCGDPTLSCPRQRDSGDDEDMDKASEDEEGQLEEQIERLQEKVESAQSEQKNLFLVIFQVLSASFPTIERFV